MFGDGFYMYVAEAGSRIRSLVGARLQYMTCTDRIQNVERADAWHAFKDVFFLFLFFLCVCGGGGGGSSTYTGYFSANFMSSPGDPSL